MSKPGTPRGARKQYDFAAQQQQQQQQQQLNEGLHDGVYEGGRLREALDFGVVQVSEKAVRSFNLSNTGRFPLEFKFSLNKALRSRSKTFSVEPMEGVVPPNETLPVTVTFAPTASDDLDDCKMQCRIKDGATYEVPVHGRAAVPELDILPGSVRFGKVFVYKSGMPVTETMLTLVNRDAARIVLTSSFQSTDDLQFEFANCVLEPGEKLQVPVRFMPRQAQAYEFAIPLQINSLSTVNIGVSGVGVPVQLHLERATSKVLDFGALQAGSSAKKTTRLVNSSQLPLPVRLAADDKRMSNLGLLLSPYEEVTLAANGGFVDIDVLFEPRRRTTPFAEEVSVQYLRQLEPLLLVKGACHGISVELDHNQLSFTAVVGSTCTRRVVMANAGDIGTRFSWDGAALHRWFSITPLQGYVSPSSEVVFTVTFKPTSVVSQEIRCDDVKCSVEGLKRPLLLDLVGTVQQQQAERDVLSFQTDVRTKETKTVRVVNDTAREWLLHPIIDNEFFSGPDTLDVPAGETRQYPITYHPLRMTGSSRSHKHAGSGTGGGTGGGGASGGGVSGAGGGGGGGGGSSSSTNLHTGSVFFPLPDGKAILHRLLGQANAPKPQASLTREVPCKVWYKLLLTVDNWLPKSQRFKVSFNRVKAEPSTIVKVCLCVSVCLCVCV